MTLDPFIGDLVVPAPVPFQEFHCVCQIVVTFESVKYVCVTVLFDAMMAALLSHTNLIWRRHTSTDRCCIPIAASPAIVPPSSDMYDVM
jgi:hypothetical protein